MRQKKRPKKNKLITDYGSSRRGLADQMPLVSIITVCRNSEKTIAKAIESVHGQTYPNIEYLIIDGASTDKTLEIVRTYELLFKDRMRVLSEKDNGIYDAMNKGITLAGGKIIGILNSDDWYEEHAVEDVVESFRVNGAGVYYGILRILEDGKEVMLKAVNSNYLFREVVGHPAYFIVSDVYERYGCFNLDFKIAADYELMMRLHDYHVPFFQINTILANFSQGGKSTTNVLRAMKEWAIIRRKYGYLTNLEMVVQVIKNRIGFVLQRWSRQA
jgi:glycosyltransferase involved in cell wall biosynthesis